MTGLQFKKRLPIPWTIHYTAEKPLYSKTTKNLTSWFRRKKISFTAEHRCFKQFTRRELWWIGRSSRNNAACCLPLFKPAQNIFLQIFPRLICKQFIQPFNIQCWWEQVSIKSRIHSFQQQLHEKFHYLPTYPILLRIWELQNATSMIRLITNHISGSLNNILEWFLRGLQQPLKWNIFLQGHTLHSLLQPLVRFLSCWAQLSSATNHLFNKQHPPMAHQLLLQVQSKETKCHDAFDSHPQCYPEKSIIRNSYTSAAPIPQYWRQVLISVEVTYKYFQSYQILFAESKPFYFWKP